ncbi:TVP38/TMEM64 family protein [Spiribacter sp. C176]|uniref:TVP38/TMEM64 family membrane protein n=1 Tax=Spiribacter salilacus TaxID=2664894 RepID=A0A6N7QNT3_9GAMM|nr:TVP38/TMEM64 family protein [Spiribacter salilacus]MRH78175.1 TVP38/TMEM64 family protein [Spiribacter salilacus]
MSMLTKRLLVFALVIAVITVGVFYRGQLDQAMLAETIDGLGVWAVIVFIAAYALAAVAFLPGLIFTITGGAVFGPVVGTVYSLIGATLGATLAFLAAKTVLGDWVAAKAGPRVNRLQQGIDREGWRFVALVRLVPLFPFNLLNYALGLTRIRLSVYVVTSFIAMAPGALAYAWVGHAGREALAGQGNWVQPALIALALIALVAFIPRLIQSLRKEKAPL